MSASVLPNLLVIVSDTFRRDHLGAYGNPRIRTPYLDELARSSVVFENHLLSSFPTMPARADLLTGTFAYTFMGWEPLPIHLQTIPALLSEAGYLTMGIVDTPFYVRNGFGYDRGFPFLEHQGTPEAYLARGRMALRNLAQGDPASLTKDPRRWTQKEAG
jgi:arylsulfatase A-like enzyme